MAGLGTVYPSRDTEGSEPESVARNFNIEWHQSRIRLKSQVPLPCSELCQKFPEQPQTTRIGLGVWPRLVILFGVSVVGTAK